MNALIKRIRNLLRAEPVLVSTLVTVIVTLAARYGFQLDESLVLAVALAALGITSGVARNAVTAPDTQEQIEGVHSFAVRVLEAKLAVSDRITETG